MDELAGPSGSLSGPPPATDDTETDITPRPARTKSPKKKHTTNPRRPEESLPEMSDTESEVSAADGSHLQHAAHDVNLSEELELEKQLYPGASTWAKDEERLFEVLFLRQDLPLLPAHWDVDFRGVPMVESIFRTSEEYPPIIYAHSTKEFQATMALMRLIDLTSGVRTACQSGLRRKAPALIKKGLTHFLNWAAEDGGYKFLNYVPNIIVDVIDADMEEDITRTMQRRLRALARMQREFLRVDRDPDFWNVDEQKAQHSDPSPIELLLAKYALDDEESKSGESRSVKDEDASFQGEDEPKSLDTRKPGSDIDIELEDTNYDKTMEIGNLSEDLSSPETRSSRDAANDLDETITPPSPPDTTQYRRTPPVVYGLFILRTSVFLLTVDAAKGESAYVSFHVDIHFMDRQQSVWNALTVAIAVCLARDELMTRAVDFKPADAVVESDPDA